MSVGEDIDFVYLTDVDTPPSARPSAQAVLHAFLERKYPFPSRFEARPNRQTMIGPRLTVERTATDRLERLGDTASAASASPFLLK
ncbi:hypothetical protein [Streptomyces bambusae]|uniref:Uncharacterized protein n=1 Tax=Streptomyces bambusae TaxID=1550616 RepID=A0ABS6Z7F9_9ACTN|nr:hypothetical protein [Streptomyces bambusae]MBW5483701.1 hypothetical protein [Streptomyces bambusae]